MDKLKQLTMKSPDQLGFIVEDVQSAVYSYENLFGIGPFIIRCFEPKKAYKNGKECAVKMKLAKCMWNDIELEFLEADTMHDGKEFIEKHGNGIQHLGYYVKNYDEWLRYFKAKNIKMIHSAQWTHPEKGLMRAAYFDTSSELGVLTEIMEQKT